MIYGIPAIDVDSMSSSEMFLFDTELDQIPDFTSFSDFIAAIPKVRACRAADKTTQVAGYSGQYWKCTHFAYVQSTSTDYETMIRQGGTVLVNPLSYGITPGKPAVFIMPPLTWVSDIRPGVLAYNTATTTSGVVSISYDFISPAKGIQSYSETNNFTTYTNRTVGASVGLYGSLSMAKHTYLNNLPHLMRLPTYLSIGGSGMRPDDDTAKRGIWGSPIEVRVSETKPVDQVKINLGVKVVRGLRDLILLRPEDFVVNGNAVLTPGQTYPFTLSAQAKVGTKLFL